MIDKHTIDKIHLATNVVDVVGDFILLNRKGTNYQACCPFHDEKTPSFVVSPAKGIYKCFGCGKAGNSLTFIMEHEGLSYVEALKYLAKKYGIDVVETEQTAEQVERKNDRESLMALNEYTTNFFIDKLNNSTEGRNVGKSYFYERGFTDATIAKFQLGFAPSQVDLFVNKALNDGYKEKYILDSGLTLKNDRGGYYDRFSGRVIFPIHSLSGSVLGFGGRILTSDKNKAKYLNSPESELYKKSQTLYGIYFAKSSIVKENKCILVEGYTDVISMMQSGIENVVASSGTSLTQDQIKLISRFTKNVTVIYDGDKAGIKASLRGIDMILAQGLNVRIVSLPDGEDPDSFAKANSAAYTKEYIAVNEEDFLSFKTKLLISEVNNDPMGRADVITEIINTIAIIPNEILRSQYSKQCAIILDEREDLITRNVERKYIKSVDGEQGVKNYDYKILKDKYESIVVESEPICTVGGANEVELLEKELIRYLLKYGTRNITIQTKEEGDNDFNIANEIIEELKFDDLSFENIVCQTIFEKYVEIREEGAHTVDSVIMNSFINHHNTEVSNFVIDLITQDEVYKPSKIWAKLDRILTEEDTLNHAVPKAIAIYKLKVLEKMKDQCMIELRANKDNIDILLQVNEINKERKKTCEKYSRII